MVSLKTKGPLLLLSIVATTPWLGGFVLLSGPEEARLEVSVASPSVTFILDKTQNPTITGKDTFQNGAYANLSDADLYATIVQLAMAQWNNVRGSYVQLKLDTSGALGTPSMNSDDHINSIVLTSTGATVAALAMPIIDGSSITDCDVEVGKTSNTADDLAFILMHELGHCLGLGHNHNDYDAVMGYSRASHRLHLGADDMAGVIYLYPDPAVVSGKEKEMIGCGSVDAGREQNKAELLLLVMLLAMPVLVVGPGLRKPECARRT